MRFGLMVCAAALAAVPGHAQEQDFSKVEIKVEKVAPGIAVLIGAGGNMGLSYGTDGNVLIDDEFAPLTPKVLAAIKSLDPDPVRFLINTHWHGDHTGGNENLGKAGALILAQDNVRTRLASEQTLFGDTIPPSPPEALPVVTYADGVNLHLNGDTLQVIHVANAHTDGDSLIYWRQANVIHMGDVFFNKVTFPFIDVASGGSLAGMIAGANAALKIINDKTVVIPGHGPVGTRADLVAQRDMMIDVRDKVAAGIGAGQTLEQIQASKPAAAYGMEDGFIKPDQFVQTVYEELKRR